MITRHFGLLAALVSLGCPPAPAIAQTKGTWRISGDISGRDFVIDCRFDEQGSEIGGVCTEIDKKGKAGKQHRLSSGSVHGQTIRWTYPTKVMLMSIDIDFAGTVNGGRMTGAVVAKGRKGAFTGTRL